MEAVLLMDRIDKKFVFNLSQLPDILNQLKNDYTVLEVADHRMTTYETLYFDTKDFSLYHTHHRGGISRFKIRARRYVESNIQFFEVKYKNRKGRVIKDRVLQNKIDNSIIDAAQNLLHSKTPLKAMNLEPKIWVNYSRMTFVSKHSLERVTIDVGLTFKMNDQNKSIDNIVIAEVKQDTAIASAFMKVMKRYHIREFPISKYCLGVLSLFQPIKYNNFKSKLILIKKILYGTPAGTY
ncbi:MAG: polyphosphate polymerase domain-containing protein, partial [Bacteroidia bacterium]